MPGFRDGVSYAFPNELGRLYNDDMGFIKLIIYRVS